MREFAAPLFGVGAGRYSSRPRRRFAHPVNTILLPPSSLVEYAYYASVLYAIVGVAVGVAIPFLGAGILAVLAAHCIYRVGPRGMGWYRPVVPALVCAILSIVVQLVVHGEPLTDGYVRSFIAWIPALIVVQTLLLRNGFLNRFAIATFATGLVSLFYGTTWSGGGVDRLALDSTVGLSNPNDLAAWFGFCAVYFVMWGIETRPSTVRFALWATALVSLYLVGLTVSRGKLLAVAISTLFGFRDLLKRGFVPLVVIIALSYVAYVSGLFDRIAALYFERGTQETGRLLVWPLALARFWESPFFGVGASGIPTYIPGGE